ncbi:Hypothetical predicted protein [Mytilus galloprovincialis]|uniref:C-type lectin domain-containing protein n=1 Tax=Mytilus galloprovincialis TaxID=29158 RepID=A0A8B6CD92_MYTGA|nr:Hypothetical predicted protein [Mytilus galloprovincialis]
MQNVTFYNTPQTWKSAANFCSHKGGVLESNVTLIMKLDEFKSANEDVWIGKFKTLTNWTYIQDQLPKFGSADKDEKCIAAKECAYGKLKRSYEKCSSNYYVTCDNGIELDYKHGKNYHAAAKECESQGSFIKWYSDILCVATDLPSYWTSGTRLTETFLLRKLYFTENLQTEECYMLRKNGEEGKENCTDDLQFFCNFETDEEKGDIISIPNLSMSPKTSVQSDNSRDVIIGIGVSITVVIMILVGTISMIRRIRSKNLLPLSTIVKDEPSTRRMDSSTVTAAYEELNKTDKDKICKCSRHCHQNQHKISIEEERNKYETIEEPSEKYSNALTAEYEQLEQTEIVKTTNVYDPLHYTRVKDDPTNARSNNSVSREEHRKYEIKPKRKRIQTEFL